MHRIIRQVTVSAPIEKVWDFIRNPENLNAVTPEKLDFSIVSPLPETMFNGLLIEYRIKIPVIGKQRWVTEIKHIRPRISFVDEQRLGPYTFWYHYHEIEAGDKGVIIRDQVDYRLPFGVVGVLVHKLFVKPMLNEIFDYRQERFKTLLS